MQNKYKLLQYIFIALVQISKSYAGDDPTVALQNFLAKNTPTNSQNSTTNNHNSNLLQITYEEKACTSIKTKRIYQETVSIRSPIDENNKIDCTRPDNFDYLVNTFLKKSCGTGKLENIKCEYRKIGGDVRWGYLKANCSFETRLSDSEFKTAVCNEITDCITIAGPNDDISWLERKFNSLCK